MITVGLRVVLGLTFAIATVAAWAGPVAAVDGADFLIWQWQAPGARGLGVIKTGPGTLQVEVIGLKPNKTVGIVLNTVGCGKTSKPANTLAAYGLLADTHGAGYLSLQLENVLISSIRSVRLFNGNTQLDCSRVSGQGSGDPVPTESISFTFFDRNGLHFAVMVEVENDETHWVGHDFVASDEYYFVASHAKCPNVPNGIVIEDILISSVKGTIYKDETDSNIAPGVIRSFQVFHGATRVACSKAINAALVT